MSPKVRDVLAVHGLVVVLACVTWRLRTSAPPAAPNMAARAATPAVTVAAPDSSRAPEVSSGNHVAKEARTGTNAADLFKDAIALWKTLTPEEIKMLANPRDEVDAAAAEALFNKIQPIMDLLRRAKAEGAYADWGFGPPRTDSLLPQLTPVMNLGKLAAWESAYRFPTDPEGAVADLAAQAYLADSVKDQALIGYLIGSKIDAMGADVLRENFGALTPNAFLQAGELVGSISVETDLARAMRTEADFSSSLIASLNDPKTRDQTWQSLMAFTTPEQRASRPPDPASVRAQAEWVAKVEKEFGTRAFAPESEFAPWWAQVKADAIAQGPLAADTLPALESMRAATQRNEIRQAMLMAGLATVEVGPVGAARIPDPVTGQPFVYAPTASGFELRSTFLFQGKPVTMSFTAPPAE